MSPETLSKTKKHRHKEQIIRTKKKGEKKEQEYYRTKDHYSSINCKL